MNYKIRFALVTLSVAAVPAFAADLMPDLSTVPAGWQIDRTAPAAFANLGSVNGENNVLGITNDTAANTSGSNFGNTQGESTAISGGVGDDISVLLYIPDSWSSSAAGAVQTGLWVSDGANDNFGIIDFTNFGTNNLAGQVQQGSFVTWDDPTSTWTISGATVNYDAWNLLDIQYTSAGTFSYFINGSLAGTGTAESGNPVLNTAYIQTYNFNNSDFYSYLGSNPNDLPEPTPVVAQYTADYANTPEPATFGLIGLSLFGLAAIRKKLRA